jgi:hypothetical protein
VVPDEATSAGHQACACAGHGNDRFPAARSLEPSTSTT